MGKLVVFRLINCQLEQPSQFTVEIGEEGQQPTVQWTDELPSCKDIYEHYEVLQETLKGLEAERGSSSNRALVKTHQLNLKFSDKELIANLSQKINKLLEGLETSKKLREELQPSEKIRLVLETDNPIIQKLPWLCWNFFERYKQAEITFSLPSYRNINIDSRERKEVKVLAILGDATGINLEEDKLILENLASIKINFLLQPSREEIFDNLRDGSYNILFFAGHSYSRNTTGDIQINPDTWLPISTLKKAVNQAIINGVRLAIFNSCDGLGLAQDLLMLDNSSLTTIVMRLPIPDKVAHDFLKYFFQEFISQESIPIYLAVRQARQRLKETLEDEYPCASWLPAIFQNKAQATLTWRDFLIVDNDEPISVVVEKKRSIFQLICSVGLTGFDGALIAIAISSWLGTSLIISSFWIFWGMLIFGWLCFAKFPYKLTHILLLTFSLMTSVILLSPFISLNITPRITILWIGLFVSGLAVIYASSFWLIFKMFKRIISKLLTR